jgi:hypothetical protein
MAAEKANLEVPVATDRPESTTTTLRGEDLQEKKEERQTDEDVETGTLEGNNDSDNPDDDYPTGINMFFIVLALVMAVFLFSLDLVC